jgi:hypothetical protein
MKKSRRISAAFFLPTSHIPKNYIVIPATAGIHVLEAGNIEV